MEAELRRFDTDGGPAGHHRKEQGAVRLRGRFFNFATLNTDDIDDLVKKLTRCMAWDAIALQEVGRGDAEADDAVIRSTDGHLYFTSQRQAVGTRARAVAVHRRWAAAVRHVEHAPHATKVTIRVRQGGQQSETDLALMSIHMPSSIGHSLEELDTVMQTIEGMVPGKRVMCMIGADLNIELMDPHANDRDNHIGAALEARGLDKVNDHHEMVRAFVWGAGLRLHNTFDKWWKNARTDHYEDSEDHERRATSTANMTDATQATEQTTQRFGTL